MRLFPVRNRDTGSLWLAGALNAGSSWVMQVGVFVYVLRHAGASTLALVELAGTLPALLWMPFAGAFADRRDPRRLALGSMAAQTVAVLAALVLMPVSLWGLAACYGLQGAANALWPPARQRWLYAAVPEGRRAAANAALGTVGGVMTIVGAALGGVLSAWSPSAAMAVAAVLQLAAVPTLSLPGRPAPGRAARPATAPRTTLRADLAGGFTALRGLPLARSVIWIGIAWGFIGGGYNVLLAAYVTERLRGGAVMLGCFYVVDGAAVLFGAALAARVGARRHLGVYALAYVVQGLGWGAMFLPGLPAAGAACLAVMRTASGVIIALDTTILLATVPADLRGRVTSLHMTSYGAVSRLALAAFGGILAAAGTEPVGVATGAASVLVGAVWWALDGRRARRRYPGGSVTATGPAPVRAEDAPAKEAAKEAAGAKAAERTG